MKIIDRYLAHAVIVGALATMAVLLPLIAFFLVADEMDAVKEQGYRLTDALIFVSLSLPRFAYQLFPIATLIGALMGLGALASRSELVAMRAAGVSIGRIVGAAMLGGLVLAVLAVAVGEGLAPIAEREGMGLRRMALSGEVTQQTPYGFWAVDEGAYVNIREIQSGTSLKDIYIYQVDSSAGTLVATHAERARYLDGQWVLEGIARSRAGPDGVEVERVANSGWSSMLDPGLLKLVVVDPKMLPAWGLWRYIRFMTINEQDATAYEVVFWGKVVHPLLTLSMVLVSVPILLASARTRGIGPASSLGSWWGSSTTWSVGPSPTWPCSSTSVL